MNILGNNQAKMNNVIFANRNKEYGAYVIRSEYNESLRKSLLLVGGFVMLLFGAVYGYNYINAVKADDKTVMVEDLTPMMYDNIMEMDLTPIKEKPVEQVASASASPSNGLPTVINDNAVVTNSINLNNPINGKGPDDANGTSTTSTIVTTSTVETIPATSTVSTGTEILIVAEEMPEFEGGVTGLMRYIGSNISYPEAAKISGREGTVFVSFVVNESGFVEGVKVMRGIGYGCDEEVVKVLSDMPKWKKAGKNNGRPVKVRFNIPVAFKLK